MRIITTLIAACLLAVVSGGHMKSTRSFEAANGTTTTKSTTGKGKTGGKGGSRSGSKNDGKAGAASGGDSATGTGAASGSSSSSSSSPAKAGAGEWKSNKKYGCYKDLVMTFFHDEKCTYKREHILIGQTINKCDPLENSFVFTSQKSHYMSTCYSWGVFTAVYREATCTNMRNANNSDPLYYYSYFYDGKCSKMKDKTTGKELYYKFERNATFSKEYKEMKTPYKEWQRGKWNPQEKVNISGYGYQINRNVSRDQNATRDVISFKGNGVEFSYDLSRTNSSRAKRQRQKMGQETQSHILKFDKYFMYAMDTKG